MLLRKRMFVLSVITFSLLFVACTSGRDYYISSTGDDTNPATEAEPWKSIEKVNATDFEPGDKILFQGGEKIGDTVVGKYVDPKLIKAGMATLTDPKKLTDLKEYRLKADSPCISAGLPIENNGGRDLWGNKVPEKGKPSIGACQAP